jgi:hypothetical protein
MQRQKELGGMNGKLKQTKKGHVDDAALGLSGAANVGGVKVPLRAVTDSRVLDQGRVYAEACRQTTPMADPGSPEAARIADMIRKGTARPNGVSEAVANRMATSGRTLDSFIEGANPVGKAAEAVTALDCKAMHASQDAGIVNPPEHIASNVHDIRLAPDCSSRKDLVFGFDSKSGKVVWKYSGQVKTGGAQYVADTLVKMAKTSGYGKVGYVDARYVNADGTPRIASDAFTPEQARKLQEAKVRLRGIQNLEARADQLMADIKAGKLDGLDPVARQELHQLREDIAAAYKGRGMLGRIGGAAAAGAATAAVVSLIVQLATEGKVDVTSVGKAAGTGAAFGVASTLADTALYHLGHRVFDMAPEVAKEFAGKAVPIGFCLFAVATDVVSEVRAANRGDVTAEGAAAGAAMKIALDVLPLLMAPLGLLGVPLLIAAQIGGRMLITKVREADRVLEAAIAHDLARADSLLNAARDVAAQCDETDALFASVMGLSTRPSGPTLSLVKN